ncbi:MAG: barstar family protein [Acidimicrobiales bacterium]
MNSDPSTGRASLFPPGVDQVQLYHSHEQLQLDVERCRAAGWEVIELDASGWSDGAALHDDFSTALTFPDYYGRNLDALHDMMLELAAGSRGFSDTAAGGLLVLQHFDSFLANSRSRAEAVVEILATATSRALQYGWPLVVFLQSDDPQLRLGPVAPIVIGWNPGERIRSKRPQ